MCRDEDGLVPSRVIKLTKYNITNKNSFKNISLMCKLTDTGPHPKLCKCIVFIKPQYD